MSENDSDEFLSLVLAETGVAERLEPVTASVVGEWVRDSSGLEGRLERIPTEKDDTFLLRSSAERTYLVKLSPSSEDPALVDLQTAAMVHLEVSCPDLPVQRVLPLLNGERSVLIDTGARNPRVLRILTYLPGRLLKDVATERRDWRSAGSVLGLLTRALEGFDHPSDRRLLLWDMANFDRMGALLEYATSSEEMQIARSIHLEYVETVSPRLPALGTQVIHGDFSPFNAVADPASPGLVTGILDFGDVVRTCHLFDPGVAMANLIGFERADPWGHAIALLQGYQRTRHVGPGDVALLREIALGRLLLRALVGRWRAHVDPDRQAYLMTHAWRDWDSLRAAIAVPASEVRQRLRETALIGSSLPGRPGLRI